jgi:hypothetical protein
MTSMTAYESPPVSDVLVLTDEQGSILAAAVQTVDVESISAENVPPQVLLSPSEGQVLHEVTIPGGADGNDLFNSINQWVVQVDVAGAAALVPRTGAQSPGTVPPALRFTVPRYAARHRIDLRLNRLEVSVSRIHSSASTSTNPPRVCAAPRAPSKRGASPRSSGRLSEPSSDLTGALCWRSWGISGLMTCQP